MEQTNSLIEVAGAIGEAYAVPGIGILKAALAKVMSSRLVAAREILLGELKRGSISIYDPRVEDSAAVCFRYFRAAQEGTARLNLRLLASVIAGKAEQASLYADEFLRYADILASLSRQEVIAAGALCRHWESQPSPVVGEEDNRAGVAMLQAIGELVPGIFPEEASLFATFGALSRHGLVFGQSGWGAIVYTASPLLFELRQLAAFESALTNEPDPSSTCSRTN